MRKRTENKIPVSIGIPLQLLMIIDKIIDKEKLSRSEYIVGILKETHRKELNEALSA